ncbi:hypothetical protein BD410DRAFT_794895 [Rickenella mellea]|uniref:Uncharacterized protein n=1 Tax=Rickenella mellea TaxID=50990 RepID=A0A4Y7PN59_9AGAM|nr:hypothetical protein BD410DRAFT_794895 [Rickenella mellea]
MLDQHVYASLRYSITCAYLLGPECGGQDFSYRCLDAFPLVTERILSSDKKPKQLTLHS